VHKGVETYKSSTLFKVPTVNPVEWRPGMRRTGLIGKKLGHYPLWTKEGKKITTTVLQIVDNHVIKYTPPEKFDPKQRKPNMNYSKFGCLLIGAEADDPNKFTGNYLGLFKGSGVAPKKKIGRFLVHPKGALPPGTPLNATHFRVGDYVDVSGIT
jgi:large subunit ribosomal protein L3